MSEGLHTENKNTGLETFTDLYVLHKGAGGVAAPE